MTYMKLVASLGLLALCGTGMVDAKLEGVTSDRRPPVTEHRSTSDDDVTPGLKLKLVADDNGGSGVRRTEYRIDGGRWRDYAAPKEVLFDGTEATFDDWRHVGPGSFVLTDEGTMRTEGGLGMLWYPALNARSISLHFEWRDARTDGCCSNSGALIRFPDPEEAVTPPHVPYDCQTGPALTQAEWVAIYCGHEIQINDGTTDPQATGSVYNFKERNLDQARPNEQGEWNDYEIRIRGDGAYNVRVIRNGVLINRFKNAPGQQAARPGDPPTDARQWERGYLGLQNHGTEDVIEFRDVSTRSLRPANAAFVVTGRGKHVLEYRSVDWAGNVEPIRRVTLRIP